jgi:hypothetical protein
VGTFWWEWRFSSNVLDLREWSVSRSGSFNPGEIASSTHEMGGWVGSRVGLDAVEKRKHLLLCQESNSGRAASHYTCINRAIPVPSVYVTFCITLQQIWCESCRLKPLDNYATSRKVAGLIPDEVIGFFN